VTQLVPTIDPADWETVDEILDALRRELVENSDGDLTLDMIGPGEALFESGCVDSVSAVALLNFIEERYGVCISEVEVVGRLSTLEMLARHIRTELEASR
jgi:acyl carrier protein